MAARLKSAAMLQLSRGMTTMFATKAGTSSGMLVKMPRSAAGFSESFWLDRGGAEGDLMELNGWSSPQMLQRYGGSARGTRARRHYDLIMRD